MKQSILVLALSASMVSSAVLAEVPSTDDQKLSYGLGMMLGQRLKVDFENLDFDMVRQGIEDSFSGAETKMTALEVDEVMQVWQKSKMEDQRQRMVALAQENKDAGDLYRTENGKKDTVVTTESGLQIETLVEGEGDNPTVEDSVSVHYRGTLIDGSEFDSSYSRGEPVTFPLQGVIKGWTEGLQLMKKGGKSRLVIPAELAYGPGGAGEMIGPNATLVFEVELLDVNPEE